MKNKKRHTTSAIILQDSLSKLHVTSTKFQKDILI